MLRFCRRYGGPTTTRRLCSTAAPNQFPFDAIFVINLDCRPERWSHVQSEFEKCGVPREALVRFPAVVGAHASPERLCSSGYLSEVGLQRLRLPQEEKIWGMDLSAGAIGCAMSHIHLWSRISMMGCKCALVVEDDSLFPNTFVGDVIERWAHVPNDWELVYLSGLDTSKKGHLLPVLGGDGGTNPYFRHVHQFHRTTNCYAVSHTGADVLLDTVPPLTFQLDTEMNIRTVPHPTTGEPYSAIPHCYTMHPPLVVQATRFGSDIQDGNPADPVEEEKSRIAEARWKAPPTNH